MPHGVMKAHLPLKQKATGRYGVGQPFIFLEEIMTNLEWIKGLSVEEMAEFLTYYRWICSDCPEDKLVYCSWECEKHRREWLMKEHEMRIGSEFEKEWLQE